MRQKGPLPVNQTIKYYFKPVVNTTAIENKTSDGSILSSSNIRTPSTSPASLRLQHQHQLDGALDMDKNLHSVESYKLLNPAPLATYQKNNSALSKHICMLKHHVYLEENPGISRLLRDSTDVGAIDDLIRMIEYRTR
ncbi:hypothetical protein MAM1_0127c06014 [Mucor ambiguus]|uniref:Uncharacterized protein n=1 Tax=Mucor ambiguus TaxID=91626 RepID=A0A0C9LVC4_9FUNG|nr:hypothetical protein MAM1_0127c06014 [Mucor ambiguus]